MTERSGTGRCGGTARRASRPGARPGRTTRRARFAGSLAILAGALLTLVPAGSATAAGTADVYVVQGLFGRTVDITVDGRQVMGAATPKTVVGPLKLKPGAHRVGIREDGATVTESRITVKAGKTVDVVAHVRSDAKMAPVLTVYRDDLSAVGPGKTRLAVAHTAAAPPADIRVNGDVLFSNVANGETLTVTVPSATYSVDIVPAATDDDPVLGPVDLPLKKGTLTRVYAIGSVADGSMDAVVHTIRVKTAGAAVPRSVPTGDGGQAARELIAGSATSEVMMASAIGLLLTAGLTSVAGRRMRRRVQL